MPEEIQIPQTVTQYYGPFELRALIQAIRNWILNEHYDVLEPSYKHKVGADGADVEVKFEAERKETSYIKFKIKAELRIIGMKDVEVVRNNEKAKMQHGRVQANVSGTLELDYQKQFEANSFMKGLRDFYNKFIFKQKVEEDYWDRVHSVVFGLQRFIREQLHFEAR